MAWPPPIEDLRARIGLDPADSTRDTELQLCSDMALNVVETYLDRFLVYQAQSSMFYGCSTSFQLMRWPVDEAQTVTIQSYGLGNLTFGTGFLPSDRIPDTNNFAYFAIDSERGIIYTPPTAYGWPIQIDYTGGYNILPSALNWAIYSVFDVYWAVTPGWGAAIGTGFVGAGDVKKISLVGVGSIDFDTGTSVLGANTTAQGSTEPWSLIPVYVVAILDRYRNHSSVGVG